LGFHTPQQRKLHGEIMAGFARHNLLQPWYAMRDRKGVALRASQWKRMSRRNRQIPPSVMIVAGGVVGLLVGALIGVGLQSSLKTDWLPIPEIAALVCAVVGGYIVPLLGSPSGFTAGMMQVWVNERSSVITPERVTDQVSLWVPKVLLRHRAHEWRYHNGQPFMWLRLPIGDLIDESLKSTFDCIDLPEDLFRAETATYERRALNRTISDRAVDIADVDKGEDDQEHPIKELLPFMPPPLLVIGGILLVVMTA